MTVRITEPRLQDFLEVLKAADGNEFCSPPGLGGLWRTRFIKTGLEKGILVIHHLGRGLAFAPDPIDHKADKNGFRCACKTCVWLWQAGEPDSPPVSRARVIALRERLRYFQIGRTMTMELDA